MNIKTIFHVGIPRTGTTFLQWEVFPRLNIRYITPTFFKYCRSRRGRIGPLADSYSYILKEDTLISNEDLYCGISDKKDERFERLDLLHKLFPHAKIILGIRNKESLKKSWYKKSIAGGAVWSYEEFLQRININFFNYEPYIDKVNKLFEDVYVYRFEDFLKNPEKTIIKMCNFIGVETPEIEKEVYKIKWNVGYTDTQINFARKFNKVFKTTLNPDGIIPLRSVWHPHRIIFQRDIIIRLKGGKSNQLLPVYEKEDRAKEK